MPRLRFRDRFFTPPVARAITSPLGILLAGAGVALGVVAGLPIAGAAAIGAAAWGARVAVAVPRSPRPERIDPFTLNEPWRRFVQDALQARARFDHAVGRARSGPLRERLGEIAERLAAGVEECWRIAQRGQELADARSHIDTADVQRELAALRHEADLPVTQQTAAALEAALGAAERLEEVLVDARNRLRLLNARLDEAVARAVELSVRAGDVGDLARLGDDVDGVVGEMEALRQGLDAVEAA